MKHKIFNKALSFVLVLVMVMTTMTLVPLTASAANNLVPPVISGVSGAGTEAAPYLIADADDLAALIAAARESIYEGTITYVTFTDDIALPAETAANYTFTLNAYGGENPSKISWRMDGGNHTISGMKEPLFGSFAQTEDGIEIKNLKLAGDVVATGGRYAGALVGAIYGNVTIDNCHFSGSIRCTYARENMAVGGLVGLVSKFNFTMKNCSNSATVLSDSVTQAGEGFVGGLVGKIGHYTDPGEISHVIEGCTNSGTVSLTNTASLTTAIAGGIVGAISPNTVRSDIQYSAIFKNCSNTGTVTATARAITTKVGGIIGYSNLENLAHAADSSANVKIIGCTTTGNYAIYGAGKVIETHVFDSESDCDCNEVGCNFSTHEFDNSWDLDCNKDTCNYVRPLVGTTGDSNERDYSWYTPDGGTLAAPYLIADAADLAGLSAMSYGLHGAERVRFHEKCFMLTDNIDMTGWVVDPINFDGTSVLFEGNNKTISNWTQTGGELGGVFAYVGPDSLIGDLILDNVDISATGTSAALVANVEEGTLIYNVSTTATCSVTTASGEVAAGIVGAIVDESATPIEDDTVYVMFCVNNAPVQARATVGGIVGKIKGNFNYQISHCINKGNLSLISTKDETFTVGGILGKTEAPMTFIDDPYLASSIINCYNVGKLTTPNNTCLCYVGGIAGNLLAPEGAEMAISFCYDISARKVSTTSGTNLKNAGIGAGSTSALIKFTDYSYAANATTSESPFASLLTWGKGTDSQLDRYSKLVSSATAQIDLVNGRRSTIQAEMARIDEAVATLTPIDWYACIHEYSGDCDTSCNLCQEPRNTSARHTATHACDETCSTCGELRVDATPHTYSGACDVSCNICQATRTHTTAHTYDNTCDTTCNVCNDTSRVTSHRYTNDCDEACDVCNEPRTVSHVYTNDCDLDCNLCYAPRASLGHTYSNGCDTDCNVCGSMRTKFEHTYTNDCDADCNLCGAGRIISHVYDNEADTKCNVCDFERTVDTTKAPETTQAPVGTMPNMPMPSGCSGSLNSTYAVLALVAILGFAFVAKKKESE